MWVLWIVALVLIGTGALLWMRRLDGVGEPQPPRESAGIATDGSEGDGPKEPPSAA